jgi:transposase
MRRHSLLDFTAKLPACKVAMEACCGAHHLGRLLAAQGHDLKLMSPEYVRLYVKAHKNDDRDAEGIAKAASRPTMRFVAEKNQEQLDIQTLHRVRSRLIAARVALLNQLRASLFERGLVIPAGRRKLELASTSSWPSRTPSYLRAFANSSPTVAANGAGSMPTLRN